MREALCDYFYTNLPLFRHGNNLSAFSPAIDVGAQLGGSVEEMSLALW